MTIMYILNYLAQELLKAKAIQQTAGFKEYKGRLMAASQ